MLENVLQRADKGVSAALGSEGENEEVSRAYPNVDININDIYDLRFSQHFPYYERVPFHELDTPTRQPLDVERSMIVALTVALHAPSPPPSPAPGPETCQRCLEPTC